LHTGYPNPGLNAVLKRYAGAWARSPVPVWVHLIPGQVEDVSRMVQQLERVAGVSGVEVGLPPEVDGEAAAAFASAAAGELPVVLRLPFERVSELAGWLARDLAGSGVAAVSLAPPRGSLIDAEGTLLHGRLYGPGVFPLALAAVQTLARSGLTIIAAGGVYHPQQVEAMLSAGAAAVQLDTVLWRGGFISVLIKS
jgi:dihydroorotate dehydrogenase (NAD+) catalytic subunit